MGTGLERLPRGKMMELGPQQLEADRNGWGETTWTVQRELFQEVPCSSLYWALCKVTTRPGVPRTIPVHACCPGISTCPKGVQIWMMTNCNDHPMSDALVTLHH